MVKQQVTHFFARKALGVAELGFQPPEPQSMVNVVNLGLRAAKTRTESI